MFDALTKALAQLPERAMRRVMLLTLLIAAGIAVLLQVIFSYLITVLASFETGWVETVAEISGVVGVTVLVILFFPAVISMVIGLFLEDVAEAVEARHYPDLPAAREQPIVEALMVGLRLAGATVLLNLVLLPLTLLIPGLNFVVYFAVNGYLLGREYFELAALRRMDPVEARRLRAAHGGRIFLAGVVITILLVIPVVNLFMPVVATAFMIHIFERLRRRAAAPTL